MNLEDIWQLHAPALRGAMVPTEVYRVPAAVEGLSAPEFVEVGGELSERTPVRDYVAAVRSCFAAFASGRGEDQLQVESSEASGAAPGDTISARRAVWQSLLVGWQDVAPSDEVEAADWIHGRLHPFAQDVGSVVPMGFGAYVRIFHPASGADRPEIEVRWSDVAAWSGKTAHPEMRFHAIATPAHDRAHRPEPRIYQPRDGVLSERQAGALVGLLSKHTATPDACWLCLWEGYGYLNPGSTAAWLIVPRKPCQSQLSVATVRPRDARRIHAAESPQNLGDSVWPRPGEFAVDRDSGRIIEALAETSRFRS